ncbi:MAG: class A beta-lactamase-related serine hydrolase [Anaerolineales bacterium]|nr:class A beta-lactamase-related serine hydrolase [Anaerolineales bacterium]
MRNRNTNILLRGTSILFISIAMVLTTISLIGYSRQRNNYPAGMTIGGVPVGGLTPAEATQRLLEVYTSPIEVQYAGAIIQIDPAVVGFSVEVESMLAAADLTRTGGSFWGGYWDYLWNRDPTASSIPLSKTLAEERLRVYLETEIAPRYDLPPAPAQPVAGSTTFLPGQPGQSLDIERAIRLIGDALNSPTNRTVILTFDRATAARPTIDNLEILLKQIVNVSGFDGLIGLYMSDLQTGQEIHFAINNNEEINVEPDIAFTASSTIKVPVVVSYFINKGSNLDAQTTELISRMLGKSENAATDQVLESIDVNQGPVIVTNNMEAIGLKSTFLGGFFYLSAPNLLSGRKTPGNQRTDVSTYPDSYSQTTPAEMGTLLTDIYQCAQTGGGALIAAFPDKLNKTSCQLIIDFMAQDKLGALIQGGVPDGTLVPHKHGYVLDQSGIAHDISDAGIVYTPNGNFVLAIYTYHPTQAIWDTVNPLFAKLAEAIYNYFNLPAQ